MTDTSVYHIQGHSSMVFWVGEISFQVSAPEIFYAVAVMFHAGDGKAACAFFPLDTESWKRWAPVSQIFGDDVNEHRFSVSCIKGKRLCPMELSSSVLDIIPM